MKTTMNKKPCDEEGNNGKMEEEKETNKEMEFSSWEEQEELSMEIKEGNV